jgi:hypothetical protein
MPQSDDSQGERGFKVQDRRRFTSEGDAKSAEEISPAPLAEPSAQAHTDPGTAPEMPLRPTPEHDEAHVINFSAFLISLGTQALAYLGEMPNPVDGSKSVDLGAAKEMIDIIAMLGDKTKGNLDDGERHLVEGLLYDLRLRYVERVRNQTSRS